MKEILRSLSARSLAILIATMILVHIAVPTAMLSGLFSGIFETPAEGIRVFFIMVAAGVVLLVAELWIEDLRARRKKK